MTPEPEPEIGLNDWVEVAEVGAGRVLGSRFSRLLIRLETGEMVWCGAEEVTRLEAAPKQTPTGIRRERRRRRGK